MPNNDTQLTWEAEGLFNFRTVFCNLLQNDIGAVESLEKASNEWWDQRVPTDFLMRYTSFYAQRMIDAFPVVSLPPRMSTKTRSMLFHERIHYWQFIGSPLNQLRFMQYLESISVELMARNGSTRKLCCSYNVAEASPDSIETMRKNYDFLVALEKADTHFFKFGPEQVLYFQHLDDQGEVVLVHFLIPNKANSHNIGIGAALYVPGQPTYAHIPFTLLPIIESAALLTQSMMNGNALPKLDNVGNMDQIKYRGVWEFWKQLHGSSYEREEDLAASYLAATDLTISGDVLAHTSDTDFKREMISVPVRFGKIAIAAKAVQPLRLDSNNPRNAVAQFQEDICRECGWPTPSDAAKRMGAYITLQILLSLPFKTVPNPAAKTAIQKLFSLNIREDKLLPDLDEWRPIWNLFPMGELKKGSSQVGIRILGTMLCACYDRVRYPGLFSLPLHMADELTIRYPLPLVLFDGRYYRDVAPSLDDSARWMIEDSFSDLPLPYMILGNYVGLDSISLLTLSRLREKESICGFRSFPSNAPNCYYTNIGLGCPQVGLTDEQRESRITWQLDDWCHWTFMTITTDIASPDIRATWMSRAKSHKGE